MKRFDLTGLSIIDKIDVLLHIVALVVMLPICIIYSASLGIIMFVLSSKDIEITHSINAKAVKKKRCKNKRIK